MTQRVRSESIYEAEKLFVDAHVWADGQVTIEGQDLSKGEYEYFFTIKREQVPLLLEALGAGPKDDVLSELKAKGAQIISIGEMTWLKQHSIP